MVKTRANITSVSGRLKLLTVKLFFKVFPIARFAIQIFSCNETYLIHRRNRKKCCITHKTVIKKQNLYPSLVVYTNAFISQSVKNIDAPFNSPSLGQIEIL